MSRVTNDIAITVGADISALEKGLKKGGKSVRGFGSEGQEMAKKWAKISVAVVASVAAIGVAATTMIKNAAAAAVEIRNLATVAGISTTEFQRMAEAAKSVGIGQEKLSDIMKDVNDKLGDFLTTGAGPMADFFEYIAPQVGVTADQFARLSGPDALQLYVSSLEKANVSQAEMTFYMEALASDATALLPLLRDNGSEMRRLGDEAQATGRILSGETIEAAKRLDDQFREARDTIRGEVITALISLEDELEILFQFVQDYGVPALEAMISAASKAASAIDTLGGFLDKITGGQVAEFNAMVADIEEGAFSGMDNHTRGEGLTDDGNLLPPITNMGPGGVTRTKRGGGGGGGGRGVGGRTGPTEADLEALRRSLADEAEILNEDYQEKLAKLEEFRVNKLLTEQEFNDLEARARQDHLDAMNDLERKQQNARLQMVSGALGDLSALMSTNNKKLFAIGKAAAVAEATVSGYQAAVEAWEKGMAIGGPPVAAAFTAASLAKTGALIAGIAQTQIGGGGGSARSGGGGGGGGKGQGGGNRGRSANVALQLVGGDMFNRSQVIDLINKINEAQEDGAIVRLV